MAKISQAPQRFVPVGDVMARAGIKGRTQQWQIRKAGRGPHTVTIGGREMTSDIDGDDWLTRIADDELDLSKQAIEVALAARAAGTVA